MKDIFFNKIIKYFFKKLIILFQLIQIIFNECQNRDNPFRLLLTNECTSKCTEAQIKSGDCILDNDIIKTQWLNNIILIKEEKLKYTNFFLNSNGDLIYATHPFPCYSKRIFFGLKKNGRYYFENEDNEENPFIYLDTDANKETQYESYMSYLISSDKVYFIGIV